MNINKNSWHYKLYRWTYTQWGEEAPYQTNLCSYVQRIIWVPLLTALLCIVLCGLLLPFFWLIMVPILWVVGYKPTRISNIFSESDMPFQKYDPWYGIFLPIHALIAAAIIGLEYVWFRFFDWKYPVFIQGGVILVFAIIFVVFWYLVSDTKNVVKAWISARKQKICPIVVFTEEPTSTNPNE